MSVLTKGVVDEDQTVVHIICVWVMSVKHDILRPDVWTLSAYVPLHTRRRGSPL